MSGGVGVRVRVLGFGVWDAVAGLWLQPWGTQ